MLRIHSVVLLLTFIRIVAVITVFTYVALIAHDVPIDIHLQPNPVIANLHKAKHF